MEGKHPLIFVNIDKIQAIGQPRITKREATSLANLQLNVGVETQLEHWGSNPCSMNTLKDICGPKSFSALLNFGVPNHPQWTRSRINQDPCPLIEDYFSILQQSQEYQIVGYDCNLDIFLSKIMKK